jgi:hypothetical protein
VGLGGGSPHLITAAGRKGGISMTKRAHAHSILFALISVSFAAPVLAQVDPWEFEVYPARTIGKGILEFEPLNSVVAKGHSEGDSGTSGGEFPSQSMYRTAFELAYGLTDHLEAAAYLNLALPSGEGLQYAGSKYRLRGSLLEPGQLPIDLGWYSEIEWNRIPQFDESELELELIPIFEKDIGRLEIDLNPKFVKAIFVGPDKNKGFEFGYAAAAYYNYWRRLSPGLEFYGGIGLIDDVDPISEQQHYVFTVVRGELGGGIEYSVGPGFGLTSGSDDVLVKFNVELERFVGTLL